MVRGESDWTHTYIANSQLSIVSTVVSLQLKIANWPADHFHLCQDTLRHHTYHKQTLTHGLTHHANNWITVSIHPHALKRIVDIQFYRFKQSTIMHVLDLYKCDVSRRTCRCWRETQWRARPLGELSPCLPASQHTQGSQRVYSVHTQTSREHTRHWGAISHDKNPDEELSFLLSDEELGHATLYCHHHHDSGERDRPRERERRAERQSLPCQWSYLNQRQTSK